ncbi:MULTISPECIES: hypothetical protein [unclassified Bradyrhizobium]|uniref:hypothetical protein n=1 Tax=unclassified Bradyrhizobium TaxID=2631580 RepID=UPI0028E88294|nr:MULTISPECIES: hypothetical protein [unclassified Bradyrhizobium]
MVETPTDHSILIKIQESIAALRTEVGQFRLDNRAEHERMEALIRRQRRDSAGMLVMMRAAAGDLDVRVTEVEERITALEARKT